MPSALARTTLARAALTLNARNGYAGLLPALVLMTDEARLPDPLAAAARLPKGAAVVLRHRNATARAKLAYALSALARAHHLVFLVAGDAALALAAGADGLHLPEARAHEAAHWRSRHPCWFITAAAHSGRAVRRAAEAGAHAVFLAPVFATASHPGRPALGVPRFCAMARAAPLPVYALGGIKAANVGRLAPSRAAGIVAVAALAG